MNSDRIDILTRYYEEDPSDPFTVYALALEYLKHDPKEASKYFDELLQKHQAYLPAYYHAGRCYDIMKDRQRCIEILKAGVELAGRLNEVKTRAEILMYLEEMTDGDVD